MKRIKRYFPFSLQDLFRTAGIMALAALFCFLLKPLSDSDFHVPLIFVLAVLLISLTTDGYLYGLVSSVLAVFFVNIVFTYPYYQMDFSMTGYPLTFLCMFAVSIITCTLTTRVQQGEQLMLEAEREKMRANLLRAISHDFRTPLTSMIGSTNAVLEADGHLSEAEKRKLLTDARSEAEWMFNMVENLLSITRIGADSATELHTEPELVEEVVGEAVSRFKRQYPGFPVQVDCQDSLLFVKMDAVLIEQVLLNLLINAAIHAEGATCAVVRVKREGGRAVFRVEDDGRGIEREYLPDLFEGRAPRGAGSAVSGDSRRNMGIGLSVCRTIILAHKGTIEAGNLPGGGASFVFYLPCMPQVEDYGLETEDTDR